MKTYPRIYVKIHANDLKKVKEYLEDAASSRPGGVLDFAGMLVLEAVKRDLLGVYKDPNRKKSPGRPPETPKVEEPRLTPQEAAEKAIEADEELHQWQSELSDIQKEWFKTRAAELQEKAKELVRKIDERRSQHKAAAGVQQ